MEALLGGVAFMVLFTLMVVVPSLLRRSKQNS